MVGIIVYGLVIGLVLLFIPLTRALGKIVISIVGILFVGTAAFLLLGQVFLFLLPYILIGAIIYGIYLLAQKNKKWNEMKYEKLPVRNKIEHLTKSKLLSNNYKYNKWLEEVNQKGSNYSKLLFLLNTNGEALASFKSQESIRDILINLRCEYNNIINKYDEVLTFSKYATTITQEQLNNPEFCNKHIISLENKINIQESVLRQTDSFNNNVQSAKRRIIDNILNSRLSGTTLFMFGESTIKPLYKTLGEVFEVLYKSLNKGYKLLLSEVDINEEFRESINLIENYMMKLEEFHIDKDSDDIIKIDSIILLSYFNNKIAKNVDEARCLAMEQLYTHINSTNINKNIKFEDIMDSIIGENFYYKKRYEQWTGTEKGRIYRFRMQYKNYIIYIRDGIIENITKGFME